MNEFYRTRYKSTNIIRKLRMEKGLSQDALADIVGLSRNALASIERGESEPTLRTSYAISSYFGKSIEEVFTIISLENDGVKNLNKGVQE